jgi:hypothetical protein
MSLTLSRDELVELSGYRRAAEQIAWLRKQGIPHFIARDGHPRVLRDALLHLNATGPTFTPQLRLT